MYTSLVSSTLQTPSLRYYEIKYFVLLPYDRFVYQVAFSNNVLLILLYHRRLYNYARPITSDLALDFYPNRQQVGYLIRFWSNLALTLSLKPYIDRMLRKAGSINTMVWITIEIQMNCVDYKVYVRLWARCGRSSLKWQYHWNACSWSEPYDWDVSWIIWITCWMYDRACVLACNID